MKTNVIGHKEMAMSVEDIAKELGVLPSTFAHLGAKEKGVMIDLLTPAQAFELGRILGYRGGLENGYQAAARASETDKRVIEKLCEVRIAAFDYMWHLKERK